MDDAFRDIPVAMYSSDMHTMSSRLLAMGASWYFEKGMQLKDCISLADTFRKIARGSEVPTEKIS